MTENGHSIADVANHLGITTKSLYHWRDKYGENAQGYQEKNPQAKSFANLKPNFDGVDARGTFRLRL